MIGQAGVNQGGLDLLLGVDHNVAGAVAEADAGQNCAAPGPRGGIRGRIRVQ